MGFLWLDRGICLNIREMTQKIQLHNMIPSALSKHRLDQVLAKLYPQYSRAQWQRWIRAGYVQLDGEVESNTRKLVQENEAIAIHVHLSEDHRWIAQDIPLNIVHEDANLLIINKSAGLVVHPGAGVKDRTLVNGLLYHFPELSQVPRYGLIHRLDKDTTGLLVVARTIGAHHLLTQQMMQREIHREYQAIVNGVLIAGGSVDAPIGRHLKYRTKMAVIASGRSAVTHYRIINRYHAHTHLKIQLETGRTHQIRVHMAYIGHAIVGDAVYGHAAYLPPNPSVALKTALQQFKRQALHASTLSLMHPQKQTMMQWSAPLPEDMSGLMDMMK